MDGLSCVGMAIDLFNKLTVAFPERSDSFALVSCEEVVDDPSNYCIHSPNTKKEHVMVAARIALGDSDPRSGIVLLDPGYHINRPIVAMKDRLYPHTGWFVQDKSGKTVKEYNYELTGDEFVSWQVKEHKQSRLKSWENLIYVRRAFTKSIEVTEKRSLIYNFKSFVVRTRKGTHAGMYANVNSRNIALFYPENGERMAIKLDLDDIDSPIFLKEVDKLAGFVESTSQMTTSHLMTLIRNFTRVLDDTEFIKDVQAIDRCLEED
ncbi:uncharacterized protein LOC141856567 [Brevipalpus obovatus]|uniref:uncharacterized protein LOC141856567 n=1 Tax=Brevipalpus obovatus TaxID=246614 RepID=UPI003D9F2E6F